LKKTFTPNITMILLWRAKHWEILSNAPKFQKIFILEYKLLIVVSKKYKKEAGKKLIKKIIAIKTRFFAIAFKEQLTCHGRRCKKLTMWQFFTSPSTSIKNKILRPKHWIINKKCIWSLNSYVCTNCISRFATVM